MLYISYDIKCKDESWENVHAKQSVGLNDRIGRKNEMKFLQYLVLQ